MITDEMVEKAAKAIIERFTKVSDAPLYTKARVRMTMPDARAALEAVAPQLIAQGMREAAIITVTINPQGDQHVFQLLNRVSDILDARAQELDPQ